MASRRIQGITIELGGDSTKLINSLKDVDRQLSNTQSNLKDVNRLLKFDPKNTELLKQKQEELQTAISATKTRLERLKAAQTDALSPDEYNALQREIIETQQNLESLERQYRDFGSVASQKLQAVGSELQDTGKKVTDAGTAFSKWLTAPIAAVGVAANAAFNDVDAGLDTIILKTGATGDALNEMSGIMEDIAVEIPTSFEMAGEAIGEVNTRFGVNGEQLKELSEQYIMFAQVNGTDVTSAVDSTQKALAAFNLDADDAGGYLDYLTKTAQATGANVASLSASVVSNSTALKEMGLDLYESTGLLGQLEMSGADSSAVMSGLSRALKSATQEGKPLDEALADLQTTILNGTDSTDGLTEAYNLFGRSGAQIFELVRNGQIDFTNLAGAADEAGGTVVNTFNATLDPADEFTLALNALKEVGASIASVVMPMLSDVLTKVRDVVLDLKEKWDGLTDSQKETILKIAGVVAAIGPLLVGIGSAITTVGNLTTAFGKVLPLLGKLDVKTALIGAAVAAAATLIINHWDDIKKFWETKLKPKFEELKKVVVDQVVPKVKVAFEEFQQKAKAVFDAIKGFWEQTLKPALESMWKWIVNSFLPAAQKAWQDFQPKIEAVFNAIKQFWDNVLRPTFEAIWNFVCNDVVPAITTAWETLGPIIEGVFEGVSSWWDSTGRDIFEGIGDVISTVVDAIEGYFDGLLSFITGVFSGNWEQAWDGVLQMFGSIFGGLPELIRNPINGIISGLNAMIGKVESAVNAIVNAINSHVKIKVDPIWVFGKKIFDGLEWGAQLRGVSFGRLQYLAQGGVLSEGQRAIVGEHAPEYLTVRNGRAIVQPIPNADRGNTTTTVNFTINAAPGMDAYQVAQEVQRIMVREQKQRSAAYA